MTDRLELDDEYYMRLALAEAAKAAADGETPVGAVLVADGQVVVAAHNMRETWRDATAHAEILVIREACRALGRWRLTGSTVYVTIEPCPMCAGALVLSRVDRLVYGAADPKAGAVASVFSIVNNPALNHRLKVTAGVLAAECGEVLRDFFRRRRLETGAAAGSPDKVDDVHGEVAELV